MQNGYIIQRRADGRRFTIHDSRSTDNGRNSETDYSPRDSKMTITVNWQEDLTNPAISSKILAWLTKTFL